MLWSPLPSSKSRPVFVLFQEAAGAGVGAWPGQADDGTLITGLALSRDAPAGEPVPLAKGYASRGTDSDHDGTGYPADPARFTLDDEMFENSLRRVQEGQGRGHCPDAAPLPVQAG